MKTALASMPEVDAMLHFRPFLLDPTIPKEGTDLRERLSKKYGMNAETMFQRVEAAAKESGIPLDFAKVRRSVNTIPAHTLLRKAEEKGTQSSLKQALLNAYFLEGRDVSDEGVLTEIAEKHGFTADETHSLLASESELAETKKEADRARRDGVTGVPFFVFGDRFALSGAQPVETFRNAILQSMDATRGSAKSLSRAPALAGRVEPVRGVLGIVRAVPRFGVFAALAAIVSSEVGHALRRATHAQRKESLPTMIDIRRFAFISVALAASFVVVGCGGSTPSETRLLPMAATPTRRSRPRSQASIDRAMSRRATSIAIPKRRSRSSD